MLATRIICEARPWQSFAGLEPRAKKEPTCRSDSTCLPYGELGWGLLHAVVFCVFAELHKDPPRTFKCVRKLLMLGCGGFRWKTSVRIEAFWTLLSTCCGPDVFPDIASEDMHPTSRIK